MVGVDEGGDLRAASYGTAEHVGDCVGGEVVVDDVAHVLKVPICERCRARQPEHFVLRASLVAMSVLATFKSGEHTSFVVVIRELVLVEDRKVLILAVALVVS